MRQKRFFKVILIAAVMLCPKEIFGSVLGDADGSGCLDLKDAVICFQVCTGMNPSVNIAADINKDGDIDVEEAIFVLHTLANMIDSDTMYGKFIAGYQGWFSCPGDGSKISNTWGHWFHWDTTPDAVNLKVDMWPDMSELDEDELFSTNMKMPDGTPAKLFSAYKEKTVLRHFKWMQEYGIDGVFLQRFVTGLYDRDSAAFDFAKQVMQNVRTGAESYGRIFAVEYDTTSADPELLVSTIQKDWIYLVDTLKITESRRYLRHKGKPVVVIWGLGYSDDNHKSFTPDQAMELITWFKNADEKYQATLVGGVPSRWRTCRDDSLPDPDTGVKWSEVYRSYDVILPWTVGRYSDVTGADSWKQDMIRPDLAEAMSQGIDYMPVVFPGFSFYNMHRHPLHPEDETPPLNEIKRDGGNFYWRQIFNAISAFQESASGYAMIKAAMFDEVDEGTAIFKVAPTQKDIPVGTEFVTLDIDGYELSSDRYLRLTGKASEMLRGEMPLTSEIPK